MTKTRLFTFVFVTLFCVSFGQKKILEAAKTEVERC